MVILLSRTGKQRALSRLHSVGMSGLQVVVLQPGHQGASQLDGGNPGWLAQVVGGRAQPRGRVESAGPGHVAEPLPLLGFTCPICMKGHVSQRQSRAGLYPLKFRKGG